MAFYRDRTSGLLTTLAVAQAAHPNVSFGQNLIADDYTLLNIDPVYESPVPQPTSLQTVVEIAPAQGTDGNWYRTYKLSDATAGLTTDQLTAFKTTLGIKQRAIINISRNATLSGGYQYNFSACNLDNGASASTITVNTAPGLMTIQTRDSTDTQNLQDINAAAQLLVSQNQGSTAVTIRTAENANVLIPASTFVAIYSAYVSWKTSIVLLAASLKNQLSAIISDTTQSPANILAIVWPADPTSAAAALAATTAATYAAATALPTPTPAPAPAAVSPPPAAPVSPPAS